MEAVGFSWAERLPSRLRESFNDSVYGNDFVEAKSRIWNRIFCHSRAHLLKSDPNERMAAVIAGKCKTGSVTGPIPKDVGGVNFRFRFRWLRAIP